MERTRCFGEEMTHMGHDVLAGVTHQTPTTIQALAHFCVIFEHAYRFVCD